MDMLVGQSDKNKLLPVQPLCCTPVQHGSMVYHATCTASVLYTCTAWCTMLPVQPLCCTPVQHGVPCYLYSLCAVQVTATVINYRKLNQRKNLS